MSVRDEFEYFKNHELKIIREKSFIRYISISSADTSLQNINVSYNDFGFKNLLMDNRTFSYEKDFNNQLDKIKKERINLLVSFINNCKKKDKELNNSAIAEKCGITNRSLNNYLKGEKPSKESALKLCLGLRLNENDADTFLRLSGFILHDSGDELINAVEFIIHKRNKLEREPQNIKDYIEEKEYEKEYGKIEDKDRSEYVLLDDYDDVKEFIKNRISKDIEF